MPPTSTELSSLVHRIMEGLNTSITNTRWLVAREQDFQAPGLGDLAMLTVIATNFLSDMQYSVLTFELVAH
jgi:hypothetical protein